MPYRQEVKPNAAKQVPWPSFIKNRVLGGARHPQRLFDASGAFNKKVTGVNRESLWSMAWFLNVVEMSWPAFMLISAFKFLIVNVLCASVYYLIAVSCGAEVTAVVALYFNAVTLVGNGGYMGEDVKMTTPGSSCYDNRTYLVLFESYLNIAISGVICALFVTKVASHRSTRHYIVFSNYVCASNYDYESDFAAVSADLNVREVVDYRQSVSSATSSLTPHGHSSRSSRINNNPNGDSKVETASKASEPITEEDGHLSFRVGSIHHESVIGGQLRVFVVAQTRNPQTKRIIQRTTQIGFSVLEEDHDEAFSDLLLWSPVTVVIPLANNAILARAIWEGTNEDGNNDGCDESGVEGGYHHQQQQHSHHSSSSVNVQLVAVFQGTDSVTGNTIETSHCYTMNEVLKHYHFTFNMLDCPSLGEEEERGGISSASLRMPASGGKKNKNAAGASFKGNPMLVDYHHFNEVQSDF